MEQERLSDLQEGQEPQLTNDEGLDLNNGRQAQSSPISVLSSELLTLILDILRDSFVDNHSYLEANPRASVAIIASHVCSYWRSLALHNPLWWSEILVTPPVQLEKVRTYLERSKQCGLDLRIFGYREQNGYDHDSDDSQSSSRVGIHKEYNPLFDLLFPHLRRCRVLQLSSLFSSERNIPFSILENILQLEMPLLERFILEGDFDTYVYHMRMYDKMPLFLVNRNLRDLRLTGIEIGSFLLPPVSLVQLHLSRTSATGQTPFSTLKTVLDALPNIKELAIYDDLLIRWPGTTHSCYVPSLESLSIFGNMLSVSELLLFLHAPKLKALTIAPVVVSDLRLLQTEQGTNKNFQPPFPNLQSLTLAPAFSEAFEAVEIASVYFPQIKRLILANLYPPQFIQLFTNDKKPTLFPNLVDLALTDVDAQFVSVIQGLLDFRKVRNLPLERIFLDSSSYRILAPFAERWQSHRNFHVREGNLWEEQRRKALYSDSKDLFVGRSRESD